MSSMHIDYYFWLNSDWAYLGADRLEEIAKRQGVTINYRPVDLPNVYERTGGLLLGHRSPERQAYRIEELKRWCKKLGIHVNPVPKYMCPNADMASRLVISANQAGLPILEFYKAILRAEWVDEKDISDPVVLRAIMVEQNLEPDELFKAALSAPIAALYRQYTNDAVAAGVFGSPSYVYQGEVFWGQDRLDMLEDAIAARK